MLSLFPHLVRLPVARVGLLVMIGDRRATGLYTFLCEGHHDSGGAR